jgi:glycosyltransferase involved in cell wall biosynthesis
MNKTKIWVLNHNSRDIQSVNQISKNLSELYFSLPTNFFEITEINLIEIENTAGVELDSKSLLVQYKEKTPDHIAIIHPMITNHIFLSALLNAKASVPSQFIFHVFGNFTRYGENWFSLNHFLSKRNVQFVVASKSYFKLLANFIPEDHLFTLPFPIDSTFAKSTNRFVENNVNSEIIKVLYSGRYHEQKNVTSLIKTLNEFTENCGKKIHLTLVVYFDDFNPTTINSHKILGTQFNKYIKAIENLSTSFELNILPHQNHEELNHLYSTHDVFISFSTFLDEDYGNSIIESLSQGTPCIVSNWGGYQDFCNEFPDDCFGLEVLCETNKLYLDIEKLPFFMKNIANRSKKQRLDLCEKAFVYIGQKTLKQSLKDIFRRQEIFNGIDQSLLDFSFEIRKESGGNLINNFKKYYEFFWRVI